MADSFKHHFLIAMPALTDSFFYRSVVYLCEHDADGAMGLIINRPTKIMLTELLSHLEVDNDSEAKMNTPVLFGGPVQKEQGMVLHGGPAQWPNTMEIHQGVYLTTSSEILPTLGTDTGPEHFLVTLGYAGWGAGQIEQELADNTWLTVSATTEILFETPADQRWHTAANLLGINIDLISANAGRA